MLPITPGELGAVLGMDNCRSESHWVNIVITPEGPTDEDFVESGSGNQTSASCSSNDAVGDCQSPSSINLSAGDSAQQQFQEHEECVNPSAEIVSALPSVAGEKPFTPVEAPVFVIDECERDVKFGQELSASEASFITAIDEPDAGVAGVESDSLFADTDFESADDFSGNVSLEIGINQIEVPLFPTFPANEIGLVEHDGHLHDNFDDDTLTLTVVKSSSSQTPTTEFSFGFIPLLDAESFPEPSARDDSLIEDAEVSDVVFPPASQLEEPIGFTSDGDLTVVFAKSDSIVVVPETSIPDHTESLLNGQVIEDFDEGVTYDTDSSVFTEKPNDKTVVLNELDYLDFSLCGRFEQLRIDSLGLSSSNVELTALTAELTVEITSPSRPTLIQNSERNVNDSISVLSDSRNDSLKRGTTFEQDLLLDDCNSLSSTPHAAIRTVVVQQWEQISPISGTAEAINLDVSGICEESSHSEVGLHGHSVNVGKTFDITSTVTATDPEACDERTQFESHVPESHVASEESDDLQVVTNDETTEVNTKPDIILAVEVAQIVKEEEFNSGCDQVELNLETRSMPTAESPQSDNTAVAAAASDDSETTVLEENPFESRSKLCKTPPTTPASENVRVGAVTSDIGQNCEAVESCPNADEVTKMTSESIGRQSVSPTPVDTDEGGATQQCLMESSVSEDSGIDVPQATKDVQPNLPQAIDGCNIANFSEAGPDVANVDKCGGDEQFRSASDFFLDPNSLDFLESCDSGKFAQSALSRMSLYMKFDPLVPGGSGAGNSPASRRLTMWLKQQQESAAKDAKPNVKSSSGNLLKSLDDTFEVDEQQKLIDLEATANLENRSHGNDSASPRLKLFSEDKIGSNSGIGQREASIVGDDEVRQMLKIQELLFQDRQLMKDREWDERLRSLESEKQRLGEQVQSLRESQHQMRQIVTEYEKTIAELISDKESNKRTMTESAAQITRERDQALEDMQNVETAFAHLLRRYEKAKLTVEGFKKNEDTLKECVTTLQTKISRQVEKYEKLRNFAEERLESANIEVESVKKSNEAELAALKAQLKKAEMKVESLEMSLEQKVKENSELTNICDELIARVGHNA